MGLIKRALFRYAKHKVKEAIEDNEFSYTKNEKSEDDIERERLMAQERRRQAELEIARRQKRIEEYRRRSSGHITYNEYVINDNSSGRRYGRSGNLNAIRYNDSYSRRRSDDLNVPISDLKSNFKK